MRKTLFALTPFLFILSCSQGPGTEQMINDSTLPEIQIKKEDLQEEEAVQVRKIIKEGEIEFSTKDIAQTSAHISAVLQKVGGYISNENSNQFTGRVEHRMVLKVPADKFDWVIQQISEEAGRLERKAIELLDVSEEYIDVQARLKTKKELAARFSELLKKATKVDEMIQIEREMSTLQSEIESIQGRMNYLEDRVALSTLTVIFYAEKTPGSGFFTRLGESLTNGWDAFLLVVIGLVNLWVFILLGLVLLFFIRKWRAPKKKGNSKE